MEQLHNTTDDIFHLLQGISVLMTESRFSAIKRHRYYAEALTIPKIREILDKKDFNIDGGKCRNCTRHSLNLLVATLGIVLRGKIFATPFLTLST